MPICINLGSLCEVRDNLKRQCLPHSKSRWHQNMPENIHVGLHKSYGESRYYPTASITLLISRVPLCNLVPDALATGVPHPPHDLVVDGSHTP